jgi:hypothetical protein
MKWIVDIVAEHPELRDVMKRCQPGRFAACGVEIATEPADLPGCRVYGDFLIDRVAVAKGRADGRIKQDFLVHEMATETVIYYSGQQSAAHPKVGRHINSLGRKLRGTGHYGASADGRVVSNHRYAGDDDPDLPAEESIRRAISATLGRVKAEMGVP